LFAPSANITNLPPSRNINEAKEYFSNKVDFYVDGGELSGKPSTVLSIGESSIEILREGEVDPMAVLGDIL